MRKYVPRDLLRVPSLLSLSRLPLAAVFAVTAGSVRWSLLVLGLAGVTDVLDGWYARRFHQETAIGAAVDALADKVFVLAVAMTLLISGTLSLGELILLGTRDLGEIALGLVLVASTGLKSAKERMRSANVAGKMATALQYAAVVAVLLGAPRREMWVFAAAFGGVLASLSYWSRARSERTA